MSAAALLPPVSSPLDAAREVLLPELARAEHAIVAAKCLGLLSGYSRQWATHPYRVEEVESTLTAPLYNPATGKTSRNFTLAGKLDVRVTEIATGASVLIDHKTTSSDISDPNGVYWRQLAIEGQATLYILLEWLNGRKIDYALWDVVRKPAISPRLLPARELEAALLTRSYCGSRIPAEDLDVLAETRRESPRMFADRLAEDCAARPQWYFQRRQIPRLEAEIREYATELWDHGQEIAHARRMQRWPRNSGACMNYGTPCVFLGICSGYDTPDSENWRRREQVHRELPIEGDGRNVLTNSRIRTFQTCRRKHYFQYELGIERVEEEEKEALYFGTLYHQALEAWFLELKSMQQKGH